MSKTLAEKNKKILQMMANMGYNEGSGLGRMEQGITKPIEVKAQFGKQGFGNVSSLDFDKVEWNCDKEVIVVEEKVSWLECSPHKDVNYETLKNWLIIEPTKLTVDDETHFCDPNLLKEILDAKSLLEDFDKSSLQEARAKANPFETIKSAFFMNRAALKMANIDAATNFMFTEIERNPFHSKRKGPFYFADVCAGPGGFTEYILWRKKWLFKGFGLTLKDCNNDFKVDDSSCASGATFQPLYGARNDGNIFVPQNIADFRDSVLNDTEHDGVHFMMSDGGFSVEGNENLQEVLSKQLYVCQCLMALEIVRSHGHFVSKLFDVFTPFSVGLIYLLHLCFEKMTILKPNASRPANSERYLICYGLKKNKQTNSIRRYLQYVVNLLWEMKENNKFETEDIRYIVPMEVMKGDESFTKFITKVNNWIGRNQVISLKKMADFCKNSLYVEYRQENLRAQCLNYWNIPDNRKNYIPQITKEDIIRFISNPDVMFTESKVLDSKNELKKILDDKLEWCVVPMFARKGSYKCKFYAAISGSVVYKYEKSKWIKENDHNIRLVQGTILYGEIVQEHILYKEDLNEVICTSFHVIDAIKLGDVSLADLPFNERHNLIETYCQAVNFECNKDTLRIRAKPIHLLSENLKSFTIDYNLAEEKYFSLLPTLGFKALKEYYFIKSFLFLKTGQNQSFNSTYVLRRQLFYDEDENASGATLSDFVNYLKSNCR